MNGIKSVSVTTLRMPVSLLTYLKHRAIDNRRSLNAEILKRLEDSRQAEDGGGDKSQ